MITSMKIVVICFLVLGPPVSELPLPFGSELKFHLRSDCRTDFAVDVEDALGWAIEIFRPQVDLVTHADQLRAITPMRWGDIFPNRMMVSSVNPSLKYS